MELLNASDALELYKNRIHDDFAPDEVKPVSKVERLLESGRYRCFHTRDDIGIDIYAYVFEASNGAALLDYYAVRSDRRGMGEGSAFLTELARRVKARPLLIEAEDPDYLSGRHAEDAVRRLAFYERSGARASRVRARVFGVYYRILYFGDEMERDELERVLSELYDELIYDFRDEAVFIHENANQL